MATPQQRDIVEVPFYLPEGGIKHHPAIVLSCNEAIESEEAFIAVMLTSNKDEDLFTFKIDKSMIKGSWNRIKRFSRPRRMLSPLMIDGEQVNENQLERVFVIFTIWIFLLVIGGFVTALLSNHNPFQSFSGMFSALGNIGPSFMTVSEVVNLNPVVKILYIFGMLVGRLEVIPIFVLFNKEIWRR